MKRLYAKITESLAADIFRGDYQLGDRLPSERDLATQFAVSRQTIREAMIALEVDGLIEVIKGSG
ncbi:GntR family transcriptional regulator, partial [Paraglaciecola sp.]